MKVFVDVDNVVARPEDQTEGPSNYANAKPIEENIGRINSIYEAGHTVVYYTARGTVSGADWREVTEKQLNDWNCKHDRLQMGKPAFDVLIDDKAFNEDRIEELTNKLT